MVQLNFAPKVKHSFIWTFFALVNFIQQFLSNYKNLLLIKKVNVHPWSLRRLHTKFNRSFIQRNHQAYQQESLNCHQVKYRDNSKRLDLLLQNPIGLFNILKDACKKAGHKGEDFFWFGIWRSISGIVVSLYLPGQVELASVWNKLKYDARNFLE